jgi:hypothetical protein
VLDHLFDQERKQREVVAIKARIRFAVFPVNKNT